MVYKLSSCRCCLSGPKTHADLYEFSSEVSIDSESTSSPHNFIKISDAWKYVTSLDVLEESEDISKICSQCLGDLKFCYMFQKKCVETDKIYNELPDDQFELVKENDAVKIEMTENIIEYVHEEFIDEDTNDGYEDENGQIQQDYTNEMNNKEQISIKSLETAPFSDASPSSFQKKRTPKKIKLEESQEDDNELCYKCKKCDARFLSKADCREHLAKSHSNDEKSFNCVSCSKSFKNRYQLQLHGRTHTGEKPFECPVCSRGFSLSSNLQKHLDTHSTERNYSCTICNQFFKTQRSLKFHTVCYHMPEAKVKCHLCDKSFVNKSYLKMHMLYHTGEKNFTCSICNSKYYKSSHLKRHIQNVHFKLRLMKCDFCASDFVRKETYKAHIISHHKRQLSDQEFDEVLEKIKLFQPPSLDVEKYTVEKQKFPQIHQVIMAEVDGENIGELEMIEEDEMQVDDGVEADGNYYEESEIYEEEQ